MSKIKAKAGVLGTELGAEIDLPSNKENKQFIQRKMLDDSYKFLNSVEEEMCKFVNVAKTYLGLMNFEMSDSNDDLMGYSYRSFDSFIRKNRSWFNSNLYNVIDEIRTMLKNAISLKSDEQNLNFDWEKLEKLQAKVAEILVDCRKKLSKGKLLK